MRTSSSLNTRMSGHLSNFTNTSLVQEAMIISAHLFKRWVLLLCQLNTKV